MTSNKLAVLRGLGIGGLVPPHLELYFMCESIDSKGKLTMQNQPPVSIAAQRAADHLRRHSDIFVQNGPGMMNADQRSAHSRQIKACADEMAASRSYAEFETALHKAHRLGAYPYNADVSQVAFAD